MKPYLLEYLFSYKKGWLLYIPMMILGWAGFIFLIRRNHEIGIPLLIFMVLNVWVLSSWDCWWYASSFSQCSIVQSYPIFILSFGYLFKEFKFVFNPIKVIFFTVLVVIMGLNIFQMWQFKKYIIHPTNMTKEYYWNVFGVTDIYEPNRSSLDIDRNINYLPEKLPVKYKLIDYQSFPNETASTFATNNLYLKMKEIGSLH